MHSGQDRAWQGLLGMAAAFALGASVLGQELEPIRLPQPETDGGKPLMQALSMRRSSRTFSLRKLPMQTLSNLLWAASGINRPSSKRRTAPSAVNWQEVDIYVSTEDGVYLYQPDGHLLKPVLKGDIREHVGIQDFTQDAPVDLIYVADYARMGKATYEDKEFYSAADTGFISQNVYLFAASEGLVTVVIGLVRRTELAERLGLRPEQKIILAQPVGYPPR